MCIVLTGAQMVYMDDPKDQVASTEEGRSFIFSVTDALEFYGSVKSQ